jgi:hypothetical protein
VICGPHEPILWLTSACRRWQGPEALHAHLLVRVLLLLELEPVVHAEEALLAAC